MLEDLVSREEAYQHARTIEAYWRSRGHENVKTSVRLVEYPGECVKYDHHIVRSNLDHRGLPPGSELRAFKYDAPNGKRRVEVVPR